MKSYQLGEIINKEQSFIGYKNRIINGDFQVWQRGENFCFGTADAWKASTSYNIGDIVIPSTSNGYFYECTVAGTSDSSEPTWPTNIGNTVTDNTVTWVCKGKYYGTDFRYFVDRFNSAEQTGGLIKIYKKLDEGKNVVRIDVIKDFGDLSQNQFHGFEYIFEQQQLFDLYVKKSNITISFLFKSNISGKFSFCFRNMYYIGDTNTWDSSKIDSYITLFDYDTPNEFKKIVITIPLDANFIYKPQNLTPNDRGFGILIGTLYTGSSDFIKSASDSELNQWNYGVNYISAQSATNFGVAGNYIEIAELQLEEGEVATEFEHIPYDIQLQRCMRYYEVVTGHFGTGGISKGFFRINLEYKVIKRAIPTVTPLTPIQVWNSTDKWFNPDYSNLHSNTIYNLTWNVGTDNTEYDLVGTSDSPFGFEQLGFSVDAEL